MVRVAFAHDDVAATHSVVDGGSVLVAGRLVVTRYTGVGSIFAKSMQPAIVHGGASIDMDAEWSSGIGSSYGSSSNGGGIRHSCSVVCTMISCCLGSKFAVALFVVGLGEVKLEAGECPHGFINFSPVFSGRAEDARFFFRTSKVEHRAVESLMGLLPAVAKCWISQM